MHLKNREMKLIASAQIRTFGGVDTRRFLDG